MFKNSEYYRILRKYGLKENATYEEISRFRRRKLKESHPDLNKDKPNATKIFQEINSDTNYLLLVWEKEEFKNILDNNKKSNNKKIVTLFEEYNNLLIRVRSLEELHRIKSDYLNKVKELRNNTIEEEIENFRLEITKISNKYPYEAIKDYCLKGAKVLSSVKNIEDLNRVKSIFYTSLKVRFYQMIIEEIQNIKNKYNDQKIINLCNKYLNLFKEVSEIETLDKLYSAFNNEFKPILTIYNVKLANIKREFKSKIEKSRKKYFIPEIITLCDDYEKKVLETETIDKLNEIINEYEYAMILLLKEKFKHDLNEKKQKYAKDSEISNLCNRYLNLILDIQTLSELEDLYENYKEEIIKILNTKKRELTNGKEKFKIEIKQMEAEHEILKKLCEDTLNELRNIQTLKGLEELKEKYHKNSVIILKTELIKQIKTIKNTFIDEEVSNLCDETLNLLETISYEDFLDLRKKIIEKLMNILQEKFPSKLCSIEFEASKHEFYSKILKDKQMYDKLFTGFYDIILMTLERIENIEDLNSLKQYYNSFLNTIKKRFKECLEVDGSRILYDLDNVKINNKEENYIYNDIKINNINNIKINNNNRKK